MVGQDPHKCGRYEDQAAGENCHNPVWHTPDRNRTDVRPGGNLGSLINSGSDGCTPEPPIAQGGGSP